MILVSTIQELVAEAHNIPIEEMTGPCRKRDFAWPRQEAMYLARTMARRPVTSGKQGNRVSLTNIGRRFGNRDHTTVIGACRAVEKRMAKDAEVRRRIDALSVGLLI
jgi:chromosomal replication initiator protein